MESLIQELDKELRDRVRKQIRSSHKTIKSTARYLEMTPQNLYDKLSGRTKIYAWEVAQIAALYHVSTDFLLGFDTERTKWAIENTERTTWELENNG